MARHDVTTPAFWKDTAERVIATFAQVLISALAIDAGVTGIHEANFGPALSIAAAAALLALLKCLSAGLTNGTASATPAKDSKTAEKRTRLQNDTGHRNDTPDE